MRYRLTICRWRDNGTRNLYLFLQVPHTLADEARRTFQLSALTVNADEFLGQPARSVLVCRYRIRRTPRRLVARVELLQHANGSPADYSMVDSATRRVIGSRTVYGESDFGRLLALTE